MGRVLRLPWGPGLGVPGCLPIGTSHGHEVRSPDPVAMPTRGLAVARLMRSIGQPCPMAGKKTPG
jgi:hypothetical protein